jgi:hypothetical protein
MTGDWVRVCVCMCVHTHSWVHCSWMCANHWGTVELSQEFALSGSAFWLDNMLVAGCKACGIWNHHLYYNFWHSVGFQLLPSWGSPYILQPCPTQKYCQSQCNALCWCFALLPQTSQSVQDVCVSCASCTYPWRISQSNLHILYYTHV